MKNKLLIVLLIIIAFSFNLKADIGFEFLGGLSTPSDKIGDVYNSNLKVNDITFKTSKDYLFESAKLGYHIGAKLRLPVDENFVFTGGFLWNRFPETSITLLVPTNGNTKIDTVILSTNQNIIPLSVGLNVVLFKKFVGIYATGDLSYNYIQTTVDYTLKGVDIPLNLSPTTARVGAGLGFGLDFDFDLVTLNLECKYNFANLIGKEGNEPSKNYLNLTFGVVFGGKAK